MADSRLGLRLSNGAITSTEGHVVLRGLPTSATSWRHPDEELGAIVLGIQSDTPTRNHTEELGQLACRRFLAASRIKLWWMIPCFGSHGGEVPPETQFLLTELVSGGPFAVLLPLIDGDAFRATLRPGRRADDISLRIESGDAAVQQASWADALLVAVGADPFRLVEEAVIAAAALSGGARALRGKQVPASADGFGWCTWDAFYSQVSAQGVVEGLDSLHAAGAPPQLLIIDDGWQLTGTDEEAAAAAAGRPATTAPTAPTAPPATAAPSLPRETQPAGLWGRLRAAAAGATSGLADYLVQWPGGSALVQTLLKSPLRELVRQHHQATSDHARRLTDVKANAKFSSLSAGADTPWMSRPANLKVVVAQLKERFSTLRFVYCWHAMHGYWAGISSRLPGVKGAVQMPQPSPGILEVDPSIVWNPQTVAGIGMVDDISELHRCMHSYLADCRQANRSRAFLGFSHADSGVDGVKVDVQGSSGMFGNGSGGGPALSRRYHQSLEASAAAVFPGNHLINCMAHSTENLYRATNTAITRASDDFYPRDAASHTTHLAVCASNALFISPLLLPDWDMFHSRHPAALLHARARAASGGPVYVSDKPGAHDPALLKRLVLPDGSVLRARLPARPTLDTLFCDVLRDGRSLWKVWSMNTVSGLLAVANLQGSHWSRSQHKFVTHDAAPPPLTGALRPADVATLPAANSYAVYSDASGCLSLRSADQAHEVTLAPAESDILVVSPVLRCGGARIAPIGLPGMLNSGGTILSASVAGDNSGGGTVNMLVRGAGPFLVYADTRPREVTVGGSAVAFEYAKEGGALRFEVVATPSLEAQVTVAF